MKSSHQLQIPADVLADVLERFEQVNRLLAPYAVTLTARDRRELAKMGDKTLSFVTKAYELAKQNPQLFPSFLTLADFDVDLADATKLRALVVTSQQLTDALDDTAMAAGSEAYNAARLFYQAAKIASNQHVPGAKEIVTELQQRFPGRKPRSPIAPTDAVTPDA
jgi:hypothetical protein